MELNRILGSIVLTILIHTSIELPDLTKTPTENIIVNMHETATLTCTVENLNNFTVIWKRIKFGQSNVISANTLKVTNDFRITPMHSPGGDDWVLVIKNVKMSDTGEYICEVNSNPAVQVSIVLVVTSPTPNSSFPLIHNYTTCCVQQQVPRNCLGFCTLQNIILGNTGNTPQNCREHLPVIAGCMADGRNHTPCCIREQIPEVCRDVCVGKFGLLNETVVNHYTCSKYSRATLACIAEGIEILPGSPVEVQVEPLSESEIKVSWLPPRQNFNSITHYVLNLTELSSFDVAETVQDYDSLSNETEEEKSLLQNDNHIYKSSKEINISSSAVSTIIENLMPFTMYEIYLISVNSYGASLPTYRLRTLTLMPQSIDSTFNETVDSNSTFPALPDIRGCCAEKGMPQERCLDLFCDPAKADLTNLTDVMICAPWISASVTCLTGGRDHTSCCRQRGLPDLCIPLCQGNITRIDFRFFRCIPYLNSYTSCLMQGYGVVSGSPRDPVVQNIHSNWAIIKWNSPLHLASTVTSYNVHYRILSSDSIYSIESMVKSPYLLDGLLPNTEYEVYISSVNQFGTSEGSPRVVFQTLPGEQLSTESSSTLTSYNLTECCVRAQLNNSCMPLCDYRAKMADLQRLASSCMTDFHKLLKCGVAGRNHMPCCMRRMVNVNCASLCAGMVSQFSSTAATMCIPYIPDIIQCMEEGNEKLPGPIKELHVLDKNITAVSLQWEPPENISVLLYEVHYQGEIINSTSNKSSLNIDKVINVTETHALIEDLEPDILYSFYVVALNEYGSSMPSSILTFITNSAEKSIKGVVSPPHSLMITVRNTTSLSITWLPPDFSHPSDAIEYIVHFKKKNETDYKNFTTTSISAQIKNLTPNTEYVIYVTASTEKSESWPSEHLQAWTETVFPAFVEMPRIHPSTHIEEGSSMTVFCVASGTPIPLVAVYINGVKIFEEVTRHMVAVISNISRTTNMVSCTANNGFGSGSQAVKHIKVSYPPKLEAKEKIVGNLGQRAILECISNGYPQPHMMWWRDKHNTDPVVPGGKNIIRVRQTDSEDLVMQLIITKTVPEDEGSYFCTAQNPYGRASDEIYLHFDKGATEQPSNISDCCHQQMVNPECFDACSFDIDIDALINKPKCIAETSKLMHCAADGSDHRRCCQTWGVPKPCIALCQGRAVHNSEVCILAWNKQIINCFQEGRKVLPGKPLNVRLKQTSDTSVFIQWDPPTKNPQVVQYYRVYGKSVGSNKIDKFQNDTHGLSMIINGLKSDGIYEFAVKAGNHYGTSLATESIRISLSNNNIEARLEATASNSSALIIGIILTVIILILIVAGILYLRHKYQPRSLGGVSFENPSYMRETLSEGTQPNGIQEQGSTSRNSTETGWKSESLHAHGTTDNVYIDPSDEMSNIKKNKTIFH